MTDIFKSFASAMDRQIERKRFNPDLTHGEYTALSETEKMEWDRRMEDIWMVRNDQKLNWDYEPSGIQGEINGELGS